MSRRPIVLVSWSWLIRISQYKQPLAWIFGTSLIVIVPHETEKTALFCIIFEQMLNTQQFGWLKLSRWINLNINEIKETIWYCIKYRMHLVNEFNVVDCFRVCLMSVVQIRIWQSSHCIRADDADAAAAATVSALVLLLFLLYILWSSKNIWIWFSQYAIYIYLTKCIFKMGILHLWVQRCSGLGNVRENSEIYGKWIVNGFQKIQKTKIMYRLRVVQFYCCFFLYFLIWRKFEWKNILFAIEKCNLYVFKFFQRIKSSAFQWKQFPLSEMN